MEIQIVNIKEKEELKCFIQSHTKNSIFIIKNEKLAKWYMENNKEIVLKEIEYKKGKYIYLITSIKNEIGEYLYVRPKRLNDINFVYYINTEEYPESNMAECISNERISEFLKEIDPRKRTWNTYSRKTDKGVLYIEVKPRWENREMAEIKFTDTYISVLNIDEKWKEYVYNSVVEPLIEKYFN